VDPPAGPDTLHLRSAFLLGSMDLRQAQSFLAGQALRCLSSSCHTCRSAPRRKPEAMSRSRAFEVLFGGLLASFLVRHDPRIDWTPPPALA
jgi:hypothetical protein